MPDANRFYRFRSIDTLLGKYQELEKQTIYFAVKEELNDPMEGFRDIFYRGDEIIWKNLFKHYLLCFEEVSSLLIINGEEHYKIEDKDIPVLKTYEDFPTVEYKQLFEKISLEFFEVCSEFIKKISNRSTPIRRDELSLYLNSIHPIAIEIIQKNYEEKNLMSKRKAPYSHTQDKKILKKVMKLITSVEKLIEKREEDKVDILFGIQKNIQDDLILSRNVKDDFMLNSPNRNFVLIDFVEKYINRLEDLMYPKWYTSCFMTKCYNSSVWGNYGDSHKGVCLIFDSDKEDSISLSNRKFKFNSIEYKDEFGEIDFFRSIGKLNISKLILTWYQDENNNTSCCADNILNDEKLWRKKHWENFHRDILTKTKDWKYEDEYRLILSSALDGEITEENRLMTYDFNSLKGLIFGIKTSRADKLEIINIIKEKCKENGINDFEFYQAYYSHTDKNIQHKKVGFIK